MVNKDLDTLDRTVIFLQKRDGVDKALKITRYTAKILLASLLRGSESHVAKRLKDFESSVGTSRKAFRLGKFLQDVNVLRKTSWTTTEGALELIASGGEGLYYFVEQFIWLVKAGAIDKRHSKTLTKVSAWAEAIGYLGSITLKSLQILEVLDRETHLMHQIQSQAEEKLTGSEKRLALVKELQTLQAKRFLKVLSVVQDVSDGLLAINDIRDGKGALANPFFLAAAGLLSALISAHKNWPS